MIRKMSRALGYISLFSASGGIYSLLFEEMSLVAFIATVGWIIVGYGFLMLSEFTVKDTSDIKPNNNVSNRVVDLRNK